MPPIKRERTGPIKRERTEPRKRKQYICSQAENCWDHGVRCPHRTKHPWSEKEHCEEDFCSLMHIKGIGCVEVG